MYCAVTASRGDVLGHEPRSRHHRRPWHRDAALRTSTSVVAGIDAQHNVHTGRSVMGAKSAEAAAAAYTSAPRIEDMRFTQVGLFGEATRVLTQRSRLVGGLRVDWHEALDSRACVNAVMCPGGSPLQRHAWSQRPRNPAQRLHPLRARPRWAGPVGPLSAGVGHVERSPDYWERGQAGSRHPQQRVPVDQARTDHPAGCRRGLGGWRLVRFAVGIRQHHPRLRPDSLVADAHAGAKRGRDDSGRRGDRRLRSRTEPEGRRDGGLRPRRQHDGR